MDRDLDQRFGARAGDCQPLPRQQGYRSPHDPKDSDASVLESGLHASECLLPAIGLVFLILGSVSFVYLPRICARIARAQQEGANP